MNSKGNSVLIVTIILLAYLIAVPFIVNALDCPISNHRNVLEVVGERNYPLWCESIADSILIPIAIVSLYAFTTGIVAGIIIYSIVVGLSVFLFMWLVSLLDKHVFVSLFGENTMTQKEQLHSYLKTLIIILIAILVISALIKIKQKASLANLKKSDALLLNQIKQEALNELDTLNREFNSEFDCRPLISEIEENYEYLKDNKTTDKRTLL